MSRRQPIPGSTGAPLLVVFLTVFIDLLGFGIVIPLLPIYSKALGSSEMQLGLLFSSFSLMQLLFAPMWGRISDRHGRRPVMIGGLLGTAASYVLFGLADTLPLLFLSRMLAGFFGANVSTAQAYIADVTQARDRAKGMGMVGAAFGLGFTFGPLLGGELVGISPAMPGFAAAALSLCAATLGWLKLVEPQRKRDEASRLFSMDSLREVTREPRVRSLMLLYFLAILAFSGFESMFIRFGLARFPHVFGVSGSFAHATIDQLLAAAPVAGRYMFFIGLVSAAIQGGLIRRLVPRFGESRLIVAGPFLLAAALAVIGLAPTWTVVLVGCVLLPLGFGLNNPSLSGLLSRASPASRQGAYLGLNQAFASLARVMGPVLAAAMFETRGPSAPFLVSAVILGIATVIAASFRRRHGEALEHEVHAPIIT